MDPLNYEYSQCMYGNHNQLDATYHIRPQQIVNQFNQILNSESVNNDLPENVPSTINDDMVDSKDHLADLVAKQNAETSTVKKRRIKKEKLPKKNYFSQKIDDKDFHFYGCAICNVNYKTLAELDAHVTKHKDRVTSYDIKLQKRIRKKKMEKNLKKRKKKKVDVKKEVIIIKPEDGYIGNEAASKYKLEYPANEDSKLRSIPSHVENTENNTNVANSETTNEVNALDKTNLQKIYKCFACNKQFLLSYYLKLHVRSHTDEKPYVCSECGQSFITASKLGRHNKRIHLAIKYQCRICYKIFSRFDGLTRHFDKTHPEDKLDGEPYDYNAILPYLKELEETLREQKEKEEKEKEIAEKELKMKEEMEWTDNSQDKREEVIPPADIQTVDIFEDGIKEQNIIVKIEREDNSCGEEGAESCENSFNDVASDDDYFPTNAWTSTPPNLEPEVILTPKPKKTQPGPSRCKICEKLIQSPSYMKIHMRTHTGEKPFKCYICERGFITASKMHRHVLTHSKEEIEQATPVSVDIKKENQESIKYVEIIKERKSNKKVITKRELKKRPHTCEYCHKKFLHLNTLQIHKMSHEGEMVKWQCSYCLVAFEDEDSVKTHELTHEGPRPYLCTLCGKTYKRRETMIYHRKNHKSEKTYICDICSKSFNAPCKLQRHILSHNTQKFVLRYECPVCAHMFNTKYHVQMHLSTHQKEGLIMEENRNDILAMVLQNARKIPKTPDAAANLTHELPPDERSRICNICGEVFQHFYYLEEHLKSHGSKIAITDTEKEEEKKHICSVCKKGFKLHYYLKLHSFTHTKEKPYICQQCGKGFITKGKLKRHLETHSGMKKYQCHVCCKYFTRTSYLRVHVRTIHGTQDYNFRLSKDYISPLTMSVITNHSM